MLVRRSALPLVACVSWLAACAAPDGDDELGEGSDSTSSAQTSAVEDSSETSGGPETGETTQDETTQDETETETETTGSVDCTAEVPSEGAALLEWLASGAYEAWPAESGPHESTGPHFGAVRTFVNPCLFASLDADAATHPVGAAAVKQLYGAGDTVEGHSVMIKVAAGEGGDNWYWLEHYQGNTYADGVGSGLCTGCHGGPGNRDYVLTPWPLQ